MRKSPQFVLLLLLLFSARINAQISVIGELSQDKDAKPGEKYEGVIVVKNDTNEPQEAKVYQTDYTFHFSGTNNYGEPGSNPRSNARWVSFSPSFLTIPPQGMMAMNFVVNVPSDREKKMVGTYWSMLMIEGIPKGSAESSLPAKENKAQMGIMQTIRYGVQVATHIAGTGTRNVKFLDVKLVSQEKQKRVLQVDIENTGDIGMRPETYVELFDENGMTKGKFPGTKFRMYPGTSVRQVIDVSSVSPGTYKAMVVVDAGGDDVFGAQYTVKF
jgi:hypothetical protein